MKMSYKIALAAAAALFAVVIVMFAGPSEPDGAAPETADATEQSQPEPQQRKTLLSDPANDGTLKSLAGKPAAPATDSTGSSLANDVRDRIRAAGAARDASDRTAATPPPTGDTPVNATALTNTDTGTQTNTNKPETKPAPPVTQNALDAILGGSANSPATPTNNLTIANKNTVTTLSSPDTGPAITTGGTYTVQPGDTFSSIANKHYGDESRWFDVAQANPTADPTKLRVGQELKLPDAQSLRTHDEPVPPGPTGVKTYTIRPGDSLSTVAKISYGDPTLWRVIYNFNRDKIGDNPNAIQAGMTLRVPPRVQGAN